MKKLSEKIKAITADTSSVISTFATADNSVQSELRLGARWSIRYAVDHITAKKDLSGGNPLWRQFSALDSEIRQAADLVITRYPSETIKINARAKNGEEKRRVARADFEARMASAFLADHKAATGKRALAVVRKKITALQAQQMELLAQMRAANSAYFAARAAENALALKEGRFWDCDRAALKGYFHPPFTRNYLADVSEQWRAALYMEMQSTGYKGWSGDWRHKLIGTGRGYLCGVDDNGDEWGHRVDMHSELTQDQYGDYDYSATVEQAMAVLYGIPAIKLDTCRRQGDLLFAEAPAFPGPGSTLHPQPEPWNIRESHQIESPSLERNGRWFRSADPITVTHTSHQPVILPPGGYRLYTLQIVGAD